MTDATDNEAFYDAEIAPELMRLAKLCEARRMSLVAQVEYSPGEFGRTAALAQGSSFHIRMVEAAMRSRGSIDTFAFAMAKHARVHGHNSVVLQVMGIPHRPESNDSPEDNGCPEAGAA